MQIQEKLKTLLIQAVFVPLVFLLVTLATFSFALYQYSTSLEMLEHSNLVIQKIYELRADFFQHDSQYTGYAVTGSVDFMDTALSGKELTEKLHGLRTLTADNPFQTSRLEKLESIVAARGKYSQQLAYLAKMNRKSALKLIASRQGEEISDQFAQATHEAIQVEFRLQSERQASTTQSFYLIHFGIIPLIIFFLGLIAYQSRRNLLHLAKSYEDLMSEKAVDDEMRATDTRLRRYEAEVLGRLASSESPSEQLKALLAYMVDEFNILMGAIYLQEEGSYFKLQATVGLSSADMEAYHIDANTSLLGHALRNPRPQVIDLDHPGLWKLHTATSEVTFQQILLAPIHFGGECIAIAELGLSSTLTDDLNQFLVMTSEKVGALLSNSLKKEKLKTLYEELQIQSEELQTQQEELKTNNEELQLQSTLLFEQKELLDSRNRNLAAVTQEIEKQRKDLERVSQYKSQFLANLSHELRTPLNSSMVLSQILAENRQENLTPQQVEMVQQIYKSEKQLLTLISDILDLSKIESGVLTVHLKEVPLDDLLTAIQRTFEPLAKKKGIHFSIVNLSQITEVLTDRLRLEQLLNNLIGNAIKFTDHGNVTLHVADVLDLKKMKCIAFSVADTGRGIPADQLETIFEPFRQLETQSSRPKGGTGLGLSISRQLAKLIDAHIRVTSAPDRGSVFTLQLPLEPHPEPQNPIDEIPLDQLVIEDDRSTSAPKSAFLVIESDPTIASLLRDRIRDLGFPCIVTRIPEEGITLCLEFQPIAVVLDIHQLETNATYALSRLMAEGSTAHIPLYVIADGDLPIELKNQGALELLTKPVGILNTATFLGNIEQHQDQLKTKKILLLEDDPTRGKTITKSLTQFGAVVKRAGSGTSALQILKDDPSLDCLIIHFQLHDMNAIQFLHELETQNRPPPRITIYSDSELSSTAKAQLTQSGKKIALTLGRRLDQLIASLGTSEPTSTPTQKPSAPMEASPRRESPSLAGKKFLLVDDDFRNVFSLTSALEHRGAEVTMAENGMKALEQLKKDEAFDVILMDIMMPGMDGHETIRKIRHELHLTDVPILALTAKAMKNDRELSLKAGANDYLTKPIDLKRLYSLLNTWTQRVT